MISTQQATIADLDALAPLFDGYRQFYGQASDLAGSRAFLLSKFKHHESVIFICKDSEKAIGFTQLYPTFSSVSMKRVYILNDLFVNNDGRGKGAGKALLNAAIEYAKKVGALRLQLVTGTSNTHAQALYESSGWKRDSQYYMYNISAE